MTRLPPRRNSWTVESAEPVVSIQYDRGGYRGARWDRLTDVMGWCETLDPQPRVQSASGVFLPDAGRLAQWIEPLLPTAAPWGGFLAVALHRPDDYSNS